MTGVFCRGGRIRRAKFVVDEARSVETVGVSSCVTTQTPTSAPLGVLNHKIISQHYGKKIKLNSFTGVKEYLQNLYRTIYKYFII